MKIVPVFYPCGHMHKAYTKSNAAGLKVDQNCCTPDYNPDTAQTTELTEEQVELELAKRNPNQLKLL